MLALQDSDGRWAGAADAVVYDMPGVPRTWRYSDIQFISSANPFQLTVRLWKSSSTFN
jgi:hypothetical protein